MGEKKEMAAQLVLVCVWNWTKEEEDEEECWGLYI